LKIPAEEIWARASKGVAAGAIIHDEEGRVLSTARRYRERAT
jgi:hypothetical protein